jgi:outer membrane protein OmpA-like peptidoglycan-associated protein
MPPPVPAVVVAGAVGEALPQKDGLRITFGPGSSDLNPQTDAAVRSLVRDAPPFATTTFTIVAVAPGTEEDPSTPRRLSLSRALAVRSVLITEGIASARIYVKAMGANPQALSGGPPDRADVTVGGTTPAAPQNQGKTP